MKTSLLTHLKDSWDYYVGSPVIWLTVVPTLLLYHRLDGWDFRRCIRARLGKFRRMLPNLPVRQARFYSVWCRLQRPPQLNHTPPPPARAQQTET